MNGSSGSTGLYSVCPNLEGHNKMSEMKLCLQIQLDKDVRLAWEKETQMCETDKS